MQPHITPLADGVLIIQDGRPKISGLVYLTDYASRPNTGTVYSVGPRVPDTGPDNDGPTTVKPGDKVMFKTKSSLKLRKGKSDEMLLVPFKDVLGVFE